MDALIGVAGFLVVAALTPGPNNLIVMRRAAESGLRGAVPAIGGVTLGGLVLLAVVATGAGAAFAMMPGLRELITIGGCAYLAWLGLGLVFGTFRRPGTATGESTKGLPAGILGLFAFQFLNPKGWVMVLTAVSATGTHAGASEFAFLAALFLLIPLTCLTLWAALGSRMRPWLNRPRVRLRLDRAMGLFLISSAALLGVES